jgi:DUF4097 and DUF4098 domain-containing protein YvlB
MYYEKIAVAVAAIALAAVLNGAHWRVENREPFNFSFSNDKTLDVDDINGTIHVIGDGANTIRVEGERITRAEDQPAADRARRDVKLDVNEKDGTAQLYVNGPFRDRNSAEDHGFHAHHDDNDYEVEYNFTVHVPRDTALRLRNVNGDIRTEDTRGKFDVVGVNGSVTMTGVEGYGSLHTVNGKTTAAFRNSPKQTSSFKTVNGAIEASFPANLAADLHLKTLNGAAYTDFETTRALPTTSQATERANGRNVFRFDHSQNIRIGSGGPELSFETVNGDIRIKRI